MTPLVSILIPAYNAQSWIADTIQSALAQTWPRKEITVVDDGSMDQTLSLARRFASRTVFVVTQQNQGASAARNKALKLCQGDYIQWLDADDLLSPDKIAKQMDAAGKCRSKRTLISSGWAYFNYRPAKAKFVPTPLWCDLSPTEWLLRKWEQNLHMQTATWLVSRELTAAADPWNTQLSTGDDGEYFCRVIMKSNGIHFVPDAKVFYRVAGFSRLSDIGRNNKKMDSQFLGMKLQIGYLRTMEDSERVRAACLTFLQNWLGVFYPNRPDIVEQAQELAADLGSKLEIPRLRWKYAWIRPIFGYDFAKRVQLLLPPIKWLVASSWDKALFLLEKANRGVIP
jgi:glycosyltransferase involved in cell wall biosynthesis